MNSHPICVMLIDDNREDNFFHARGIKQSNPSHVVIQKTKGTEALAYLKSCKNEIPCPDLIFLDINMPGMNGWELLEEHGRLDKESQSRAIIVILTTSHNPDDKARAKGLPAIHDFRTKPLTETMMNELFNQYFTAKS